MLGDLIGEERGKVTGTRVLPDGKVESSDQSSGTILGIESNSVTTWWGTARPDGSWWGEGQGIITTKEGDVVSLRGQGVGRPTGRGLGASWRGAVYFQTASPKLARLNSAASVYEFEVDENGNSHGKFWEWK
jgi:hypothetical protein